MKILRSLADVAQLDDPALRMLIEQRIRQISGCAAWDDGVLGYFIVAEEADSVEALEAESGCPILTGLFGDARFPSEDFSPCFEWLEEHELYYEAVWILNDDGYGIDLLIPKRPGIDPELLAMCASFATPAPPAMDSRENQAQT